MSDLKKSFTSHDVTETNATAAATKSAKDSPAQAPITAAHREHVNGATPQDHKDYNAEAKALSSMPFVVKTPRPNSKLILQNMEEVLNSVKKKHRQKHRRKKRERMEAEEAEARDCTKASESKSDKSGRKHHHHHHHHHRRKPKPLQEKSALENGLNAAKTQHEESISPQKTTTTVSPSSSILNHFPRTPKKADDVKALTAVESNDHEKAIELPDTVSSVKTSSKPTNAFEVLMNARNRSIGSNTPGKDSPTSASASEEVMGNNAKRKLVLQEWAEKKGGMKRKLDEEARATYVEKQLEKRAKRLKKMLVNGSSPTGDISDTSVVNSKPNSIKKSTQKVIEGEKKQKGGRGRSRRLCSVDDSEELTQVQSTPDKETVEFLAKLSSPTKKRDNLLGYFPKKESPKELVVSALTSTDQPKLKEATPKSRPLRSATKRTVNKAETPIITSSPLVQQSALQLSETNEANTPSGRPRRSCTGKARYDYDLEESPTKLEAKIGHVPSVASSMPDVVETIDLDESSNSILQSTPKKLAPLFVRSLPKPSLDPDALKARNAFLMSGVPDKVRLEIIRQKQYEQNFEEALELFPKISHLRQLSEHEKQFLNENIEIKFKLKAIEETPRKTNRKSKGKGRSGSTVGTITNCSSNDYCLTNHTATIINLLPLPNLANKCTIVKTWKKEFETFPTYKCYNQMREKYRYFSAIDSAQDTEQVSESFVVTRSSRRSLESAVALQSGCSQEDKPPATAPNGELLFTEKYKPLLFKQFLINLKAVTQLREFLANWSSRGSGASARNSQTLDDSIDFLTNDSNSSQQAACNAVVIFGPASSGKTSAVYALANEMNFNVLEINAGMKRTGKRLIQELQEATQSHQIRKESSSSMHGKAQNNLLKMSLSSMKSKKTVSSQSNDATEANASNSTPEINQGTRKSLILIEDADIVFEQTDAGFIDAIYTLAASSKRPVIVVASSPRCQHLQRLISQNTIQFVPPTVLNISRLLAVLSLMENCPINLDDIISLYLYNRKDLRKTLLELQFFIQSGGDRCQLMTTQMNEITTTKKDSGFFASPTNHTPEEANSAENDEQLGKDTHKSNQGQNNEDTVYIHNNLFAFYTTGQNGKWRIPFPIDFRLLSINLSDLFQASHRLKATAPETIAADGASAAAKSRKTRSPKKTWLCSSVTNTNTNSKKAMTSPLAALCDFYENVSIATLLGTARNEEIMMPHEKSHSSHYDDRLIPHLAEDIAHELVEKAIEVNLRADACPYNLFDSTQENMFLCDHLSYVAVRTQRMRSLDYEPAMRAICRTEKLRSSIERRSTRFYHHLRNCVATNSANSNADIFDVACEIFQQKPTEVTEVDDKPESNVVTSTT